MQATPRRAPTAPSFTRRRALFACLALAVLFLSLDVPGMVGAGDPKASRTAIAPALDSAWVSADSSARQLLEQEHQVITAEIAHRLELEHLLFALKFVLVGGTLYVLFQQAFQESNSRFPRTEFAALVSWAAVVAAAIVDLRLAMNATFISTLGGWVRQYEQLRLGKGGVILGWEAFLADHLLSRWYYPFLLVSSQILTALLFCLTAALFFLAAERTSQRSHPACFFGALLSLGLMTSTAVSMRPTAGAMASHVIAGLAAAVIVWVLSFGEPKAAANAGAKGRRASP